MNSYAILATMAGPSMSIPGPVWLFTILQWLTFTLHLVAMNILFGGLLLYLLSRTSPVRQDMGDTLVTLFPTVMAATITLGVAPLLFVQVLYGYFFYSATIISAWNWYGILPVVIVTYYLLYLAAMRKSLSTRNRLLVLAVAAAGMIYISYTFTMISDLAVKPNLWPALYASSPDGFAIDPSFVQTIFRWAHTIIGAVAVAGIVIMLFAVYHKAFIGNRKLLSYGARIFLIALLKGAIFGLIYLFTLDSVVFYGFLHSPGLHVLLTAIVLNIAAAYVVYRAAQSEQPKSLVVTAAVLVGGGVFLMVMVRHYLRLVFLDGIFQLSQLDTMSQWGPFAMFAVTFVLGLIVLFWMIRKYFTAVE